MSYQFMPENFRPLLAFFWVILPVALLHRILNFGRRERGLPPGPPTVPILGNAHLIPQKGFYSKLKDWSDEYGSVYSLKIGRSTVIVLNDREAVYELLSVHGAEYNDRPTDEQIHISLREENIAMTHESPRWKAQRKIIATYFSPKNLDTTLRAVQEAEVNRLMFDLLEKPEDFRSSIQRTTASVGSIAIYGQRAEKDSSFWVRSVYSVMEEFSKVIEPGSYLPVDEFPVLKLIPDRWNHSRQLGKHFYRTMTSTWTEARERVEQRRNSGDSRESLIDRLLGSEMKCDTPLSFPQFNNFLGGIQMAAADTTATAILTTIMFLGRHPEFQAKARAEIDQVCGTMRMPDWSDFNDLPYVNCIIKEGLRIRPVAPIAIPHRARQDRWFKGMLIPAGSTIIIPPSALNHDSGHFLDPSSYNPDRFLSCASKTAPILAASAKYEERDHYSYGAGRRMCVGIHLAERTQWRVVAQMLWAFKIERQVGSDGKLVELDTAYSNYDEGFLHVPKPYTVRFVPRSKKHAEVVRRSCKETEVVLRQWE